MAARRLPVPVREILDDRRPDAVARRAWHALQATRAKSEATSLRKQVLAVAMAALFSAIAVFFWLRPSPVRPLHLDGGGDVPQALGTAAAPTAFDDGSRIDVGPGTLMDVLESTSRTFTLALRRGRAEFEVHPGGPRLWKIECGPVTVEVVGTHFTLTRTDAELRVTVDRGAVLVSGAPVPDHVVRLGAAQSLVVPLRPAVAALPDAVAHPAVSAVSPVDRAATPPPSVASAVRADRAGTAAEPSRPPPERSSTQAPASSVASMEPVPPEPSAAPRDSAREALSRADAARVAGRFQEAATILERVVTENRGTSSASLAEFSLGRLYLDSLGDPGRAVSHFSRALSGGLPNALAEDVYARLVEAHARSGNPTAAREVASRYRARFPSGRRLADVDHWASPHP